MREKVTVHGIVSDASRKPLAMIHGLAIQEGHEVERVYTSDGHYSVAVLKGWATLSFDTHGTLTNARAWHPSVVITLDTNSAGRSLRCDRVLMQGGTAARNETCVDALAGSIFSLMWTAHRPERAYAEAAAARLASLNPQSAGLVVGQADWADGVPARRLAVCT